MRADIDAKQYRLHLKRLQDGRAAVKGLRRTTALTASFKHWEQRIERSLAELFDEDHPYHDNFSSLAFSDGWPDEPDEWTLEDQKVFRRALKAAERILSDAIEEAEHLAPIGVRSPDVDHTEPALPMATEGREAPSSAVHVNVYNVLSQMTVVSPAQIIASLQELDLAPSVRAEAERLVREFEQEAEGKQRWSRRVKTVDQLKKLGGAVYEKVTAPLLLEYLKRQMGLGGR